MSNASVSLIEEELQLRSRDQTALFVRRIRPQRDARARLLWVHGFAEHGGRYVATLRWFAERGLECWILDLRGHGRSGGRRTFIRRFSDYLDDLEAFHTHVAKETEGSGLPLFALGHSMGGLVLARTLQDRASRLPALEGGVILSPFLGVKVELPRWKIAMAKTLSRALPWFKIPTDIDNSLLSKDPAIWDAYASDPMVAKTATTRWYTETTGAHPVAVEQANLLKLPVLVMHGDDDGLADPDKTKLFFAGIASQDKELKMWPGGRHELLNEVEKLDVREHILGWVEARL